MNLLPLTPEQHESLKKYVESGAQWRPVDHGEDLRRSAALAVSRCECRGGMFITDTDILNFIGDPKVELSYKLKSDGQVVIDQPWCVVGRTLRDGIRRLIENKKV